METGVDHEGSEDMCAVWMVGSHRMQNILVSALPVSESLLSNCVCLILLLIASRVQASLREKSFVYFSSQPCRMKGKRLHLVVPFLLVEPWISAMSAKGRDGDACMSQCLLCQGTPHYDLTQSHSPRKATSDHHSQLAFGTSLSEN